MSDSNQPSMPANNIYLYHNPIQQVWTAAYDTPLGTYTARVQGSRFAPPDLVDVVVEDLRAKTFIPATARIVYTG